MKKLLFALLFCVGLSAQAIHTLPHTQRSAAQPTASPEPVATAAPAPKGVQALAAASVATAKAPLSATPTRAEKKMVRNALKSYAKVNATPAAKANGNDSVVLAAILAFFLGGLGIHRVYMGSKAIMILFYIITIFGIFGIVPLIDFFVILFNGTGSFEGSNKFFSW